MSISCLPYWGDKGGVLCLPDVILYIQLLIPVSYTHLDVYKRQHNDRILIETFIDLI